MVMGSIIRPLVRRFMRTPALRNFATAAEDIQVKAISVEDVKPSGNPQHLKPFKLNLFDQLMPSTYIPLVSFYPSMKPNIDNHLKTVSANLKSSLSKTLNLFYPLSGRLQDNNLLIHDFHKGVPFTVAQINGHDLLNFLQPPNLKSLNALLPVQQFSLHPVHGPQIAVQLSKFDCGGIAVGMLFHHRIMDGGTIASFLETWAAISKNRVVVVRPDLVRGSSVFPPRESIPSEVQAFLEKLYFKDCSGISSGRFVFSDDSMSELKSKAGIGKVENPTRREAVTAFIWKSMMKSDGNNSNSKLLQCFGQAVNLRSLMGQRLSKESIGNLVAVALVSCNDTNPEIKDLVGILRGGVAGVDENYLNSISGEKGFEAMVEGQKSMSELAGGQQVLVSSSWSGFGFNDFDFGLGSPVWTGVAGAVSGLGNHVALGNSIVLKELRARGDGRGNEIEAWIRMDKGVMDVLERDPEFLKFASPNPTVIVN